MTIPPIDHVPAATSMSFGSTPPGIWCSCPPVQPARTSSAVSGSATTGGRIPWWPSTATPGLPGGASNSCITISGTMICLRSRGVAWFDTHCIAQRSAPWLSPDSPRDSLDGAADSRDSRDGTRFQGRHRDRKRDRNPRAWRAVPQVHDRAVGRLHPGVSGRRHAAGLAVDARQRGYGCSAPAASSAPATNR